MKATPAKPATVDAYLANLSARDRKALQALRRTIRAAAPAATEVIAYGIPGFKHQGNLVSFAAFKNHLTFFAGRDINQRYASKLRAFERTKGGIHFTPERPIPAAVVRAIVRDRLAANERATRPTTARR